jgi:hypothetical protein
MLLLLLLLLPFWVLRHEHRGAAAAVTATI